MITGKVTLMDDHPVMNYYNDVMKPLFKENFNKENPEFTFDASKILKGNPTLYTGTTSNSNVGGEFVSATNRSYVYDTDPSHFNSVAMHEGLSHPSDSYTLINLPQVRKAYKEITPSDSDFELLGLPYNDGSTLWMENRATLNELRQKVYNQMKEKNLKYTPTVWDKYTNDQLMADLYHRNGYGQDYYNLYKKMQAPDKAEKWANSIRNALKTLPAISAFFFTQQHGKGGLIKRKPIPTK